MTRKRQLPWRACALAFGLWSLLLGFSPVAWAEDSTDTPAIEVKTVGGVRFALPPDWPVEKRGGAVSPIPIEEYLSRKFSAMESQWRTLEQRMTELDQRLQSLEQQVSRQQRLQSDWTEPQPAQGVDLVLSPMNDTLNDAQNDARMGRN